MNELGTVTAAEFVTIWEGLDHAGRMRYAEVVMAGMRRASQCAARNHDDLERENSALSDALSSARIDTATQIRDLLAGMS